MPEIEKFLLRDSDYNNTIIGLFTYFRQGKHFYVQVVPPETEEQLLNYPYHFIKTVRMGEIDVPEDWVRMSVSAKVIPSSRGNIVDILQTNDIAEYDEFELLKRTAGKSAQDGVFWDPVPVTYTYEQAVAQRKQEEAQRKRKTRRQCK